MSQLLFFSKRYKSNQPYRKKIGIITIILINHYLHSASLVT